MKFQVLYQRGHEAGPYVQARFLDYSLCIILRGCFGQFRLETLPVRAHVFDHGPGGIHDLLLSEC